MKGPVAVIDIGSNSIKTLVAASDGSPYGLKILYEETLEVRISQGISGNPPFLREDRIKAGLEAVRQLWGKCNEFAPLEASGIVATSAVRSASNGQNFTDAVASMTGCQPVILSGNEEAEAIAMGVRTDPALGDQMDDFMVFDLGGGSLELIRMEAGSVTCRTSLQLGSVRLTEHFVGNPSQSLPEKERVAIRNHVLKQLEDSGFPMTPRVVGCSGGLAALRLILASRQGIPFDSCSSYFTREWVNQMTREVISLDQASRIELAGIPPQRADIFPAALLTFQAILEKADADGLLHSLHNLRFGLAWRLLHPVP